MSIDPSIENDIQQRLSAAEFEHDVRIVYACESGSRAWGFSSPDSDYDVRFIYARKSSWYLSYDVERRRDVIEYPIVDDIDIGGWDIRKALYLFTRTNGALFEWLASPIVYREHGQFASALRDFAQVAHSDIALKYHYSHMARRNAGEYLTKDRVKLKKYFYVLRPLLAIRYMELQLGLPPVPFQELVDAAAPDAIVEPIAALLKQKRETPEIGLGDSVPALNDFIFAEFERHGNAFSGTGRPDINEQKEVRDTLNAIFQQAQHYAASDARSLPKCLSQPSSSAISSPSAASPAASPIPSWTNVNRVPPAASSSVQFTVVVAPPSGLIVKV